MKNRITINGVELTRQQVEAAMAALNTPDPIPNLTRVHRRTSGECGVVIRGSVQHNYVTSFESGLFRNCSVTVVSAKGGGSSYRSDADLLLYWHIADESVVT